MYNFPALFRREKNVRYHHIYPTFGEIIERVSFIRYPQLRYHEEKMILARQFCLFAYPAWKPNKLEGISPRANLAFQNKMCLLYDG